MAKYQSEYIVIKPQKKKKKTGWQYLGWLVSEVGGQRTKETLDMYTRAGLIELGCRLS